MTEEIEMTVNGYTFKGHPVSIAWLLKELQLPDKKADSPKADLTTTVKLDPANAMDPWVTDAKPDGPRAVEINGNLCIVNPDSEMTYAPVTPPKVTGWRTASDPHGEPVNILVTYGHGKPCFLPLDIIWK